MPVHPLAAQAEDHDVGLDQLRIQHHLRKFAQGVSQKPGIVMIFLEPAGHLVQGEQASRGQNTGLAHPSAQRLAKISRPLDIPRLLTNIEPTGAHKPLDRQNITELNRRSAGRPESPTPSQH